MKKGFIAIFIITASISADTFILKVGKEHNSNFVSEIARDWQNSPSEFTSWQDIGSAYDFSGYSPAPLNQTADFQQTETYKQDQERYEQQREYDTLKGDYRDIGSPIRHEQTDTRQNTRNVNVNYGTKNYTGVESNCTAWSPDPSTITSGQNFQQTRFCDMETTQLLTYLYNSTNLGSYTLYGIENTEQTQNNIGAQLVWKLVSTEYKVAWNKKRWTDGSGQPDEITQYYPNYFPNSDLGEACYNPNESKHQVYSCTGWTFSSIFPGKYRREKRTCYVKTFTCS